MNYFAPVPDERNTPIDRSVHSFVFGRKWFQHRNQKTWSTFFPKMLDCSKPVHMIQIGVFEGMDLVWCLQNVLTHPDSRALAIDPWLGDSRPRKQFINGADVRAANNLSPWKDKVLIVRDFSDSFLRGLGSDGVVINKRGIVAEQWDLVVIDGDHRAPAVLKDAHHAYRLLRVGGYMVFDDVRNRIPKKDHVQAGIDQFRQQMGSRVTTIWQHRYCDCLQKHQ
ncbi:MAG: class I SAM-dependent methyltransferase [Planctomycetaceae bacterium]|nr:class I SAM-dependent methyltransferase [Planctomycetaceae bacterium]